MAIRGANELRDGFYVSLGIGIPTLVPNHVPPNMQVIFQPENGLLGMGNFPLEAEVDADLINVGKETVTFNPGASFFSSADSFGTIRGGHIDLTILSAMQASVEGDLANWTVPGKRLKGMGGAMDLVGGVERVIVMMEHTTQEGRPKLLRKCTLPLTGPAVVDRIITNLCVIDLSPEGFQVVELAPGATMDQIAASTDAPVTFRLGASEAQA